MRWKSRLITFIICFVIGIAVASVVAIHFSSKRSITSPCATADYFNSPEEVLSALKDPEVNVRRAMLSRLLLRPDVATVYYDYERDLNYPERADRARIQYVHLDDAPDAQAILTFVRLEHPLALVFRKKSCGWHLVAALSSWLRFEDYPYENWLSLPEAIEPGIHQLLVRESSGDSASYVCKARLFRLKGDVLMQVAEFEEEAFEPVSGYNGSDWSDVKRHRVNHYNFSYERAGEGASITNDVTDEIIKFNGAAPRYSYWLETDGSWHARNSNWSHRPSTRMKLLNASRGVLYWNAQEGRFVKS